MKVDRPPSRRKGFSFLVTLLLHQVSLVESSWVDPDTHPRDTITKALTETDTREFRLVSEEDERNDRTLHLVGI